MGTVESEWAPSARAAVLDDALGRDEAALGGAEEQRVEERVGAQHLTVAGAVGPVGVDDGRIEMEGRHGNQLEVGVGRVGEVRVPGAVRGADEAQIRVHGEDVGTQAGPGGEEGDPPRRRLQAEVEHALVDLHHVDLAVLAGGPPVGVERDGVEGDEPAHHLAHLAGRAQQADVGATVGHDGQVVEIRAADGAHDRHWFAARTPATDPDRHPRVELADDVVDGQSACRPSGRPQSPRHCDVSASRFSTKAARCSSATPRTCSS